MSRTALRQRAEALLQIAHPDFRLELLEAARHSSILESRAASGPPGVQ